MSWRADALAHAMSHPTAELCGLVVRCIADGVETYIRCRNVADTAVDHFQIHPEDWADCEDIGQIIAVVHSHPDETPEPSAADVAGCEASGIPWHIVSVPCGQWWVQYPRAWQEPLLMREFSWGLHDCYGLIRDWYRQHRGVLLRDFPRQAGDFEAGRDLYTEGFPLAGFQRVDGPPELGDVLLMRLAAQVPDHGAIYLGDGRMIHHRDGHLSARCRWQGTVYQDRTVGVLRYAGGQALR
jgi:proteasome lid subunit RPN8/RPN11